MLRGIVGLALGFVLLCSPLMALDSERISLGNGEVSVVLPPGVDTTEVRGQLIVEKHAPAMRQLSDGTLIPALPVTFRFENTWHETFMFDGCNQAVLTDSLGQRLYAAAVLRNGEYLPAGVSGIVPPGSVVEFVLLYDLPEDYAVSCLEEVGLDLRYLNHGHPYVLQTVISSFAGRSLTSSMVQVSGAPGEVEVPHKVAVKQPVVEEPPVVEIVKPAPQPEPVKPVEPVEPPKQVVVQPEPQPEPVIEPIKPTQVVKAPVPAPAPEVPEAPPAPPAPAPVPQQPVAPPPPPPAPAPVPQQPVVPEPPMPPAQVEPVPVPQMVGGCCTPCAPYNVTVRYEPIEPQPGQYSYCTTLPYGCPDGAPLMQPGMGTMPAAAACCSSLPMAANCCAPMGAPLGMGLLCAPISCLAPAVNGAMATTSCVFNFACSAVTGLLNGVTGIFCNTCAPNCCAPCCNPM